VAYSLSDYMKIIHLGRL